MRSAVEEHLGEDSKTYLLSVKPSGETPWFKFGRFRLSEEAGVLEEKMQSRMGNTFSGPADQTDLYFAVITSATDPWNNEFLAMSESIGLLTAFGAHDSHEGIVSQGYEDGEFDTGIVVSPDADDDEYGIDLEQNEEELSEGDFDLSNYGITTNADGTRSHDSGETSEQNRSTVEAKIETEKRTFERNAADRIQNDFVVTLNYSVADADGNIVDAGDSPLIYLHGGYGGIFKRVESALEGKRVGDKLSVTLAPEDAFGDYDADLVTAEPRSLFPDDIEVGMQFERPNDDGENVLYTVTAIEDDSVVVDSNHPLSGLAITFSCTVSALRPATSDESAQGHVLD
jgi:FKBP-type peptidyl-prolyl cis-trans isomerase SlyD